MKLFKLLTGSAVVMMAAASFQSCSMDEPFSDKGEASLTLTTDIRSNVVKTRSVEGDELAALREKCVVYIENSKGVIRKYKGIDNIPAEIRLRVGSYVAEAWSGDSVSASFDSKFYRGYQAFEMNEGANSLTLHCNIANVIASVDASALDLGLKDLKVTFSHSRGSLDFDETNIPTAKGYFMMPNADKDLSYKVTATKADGTPFSKEGKIENVQRAHEYAMSISAEDKPITEGGALIKITIKDIPVIEEEVEIFTAPVVRGDQFNLDEQVVSVDRNFKDTRVYMRGYFGMSSVLMNFSGNFSGMTSGENILNESVSSALAAKGINVEVTRSKDAAPSLDAGEVEVDEVFVTFTKEFLDGLAASDEEYAITFEETDGRHQVGSGKLRIANSDAAVEHLAPVGTADAPDKASQPMAILAHTATLGGAIYNADEAVNFGIEYREAGTSDWTKVYPANSQSVRRRARAAGVVTRAGATPYSVTISGLKAGTEYEYRAFCDGFESQVVNTFTTESLYTITDYSFEAWSTYSANTLLGTKTVVFPGSGDNGPYYWDSGNEGGATANKTLTNKSEDMKHSGQYSARLASSSALGMLAAGNIFIGDYVRTDGTNGVLSLGRAYNGSHPTALTFYMNYRPGTVNIIKSGNEQYLDFAKGDPDHGQVYVALTDEPIEIRTNPENRKLFSVDDPHVVAYGQLTWKENVGADGQMVKIEIPIEYKENAKTTQPKYLVVVASASKFGDYFSGSDATVMYLDDFELVYEK